MNIESLAARVEVFDAWMNTSDRPFDRWTAIIDGDLQNALAMSDNPFHPQGFGQHVSVAPEYPVWCRQQGQSVSLRDLPGPVVECILQDVRWNDRNA